MSFANKVVLITGGSSGIGAAAALQFTKEGASVAIVGRKVDKLTDVANQCTKLGTTPLVIVTDVSKDEEAASIVSKTVDKFGKLDVLVNNAGILVTGGVLNSDILKSYDTIMNTNLRPVVHVTSLAAPHLIQAKGNIINISSTLGSHVSTFMLAYCVSKAGLQQFSRGVALELAAMGVRVNVVSPGPVVTDILANADLPSDWEKWGDLAPLRKVASAGEIAELILFLASDKAKSITGANYIIDNGVLLTHSAI